MKWIVAAVLIWLAWRYLRPARPNELGRARKLLGVSARADATAVRDAHRQLMAVNHPDRGGSPEAARRINAARDTLLAAIDRG